MPPQTSCIERLCHGLQNYVALLDPQDDLLGVWKHLVLRADDRVEGRDPNAVKVSVRQDDGELVGNADRGGFGEGNHPGSGLLVNLQQLNYARDTRS